jgi:branched-chain amino acid aminotransferase
MTQTAHGVEFTHQPSVTPKSAEERAAILANPGFGNYFTDHTAIVDYSVDENGKGGWHDARIEAYGPISLDPSAAVLHYGQEIFEGLKAYRHADGSVWTFRPEANAARLNKSARRLALPELPEEYFLGAIRELVQADREWVPAGDGEALYLRPFMIATEAFLGVRAAREVSFRVIASPAGNYFGGELKPVSIWISREYARAGRGGTGAAKCGGNYAASLIAQQEAEAHGCKQVLFLDQFNDNAVEELGGMNVFFVM